jgi:glycosyltransferase involved in cell wall biosynthesis
MKKLKVAIEQHFLEIEGKVYTDIAFDYKYWQEYLEVFDEVQPIARVGRSKKVPSGWVRADGARVKFHKVYDYLGFWDFLKSFPRVLRDCRNALHEPSCVLLRMGNITIMCWLVLLCQKRPYAFEGIGHAGIAPAKVKNVQFLKLGYFIGWVLHYLCRMVASHAVCASYVSKYVQRLYPTRTGQEWIFSSVKLPPEAFASPRQESDFQHNSKRILSVGRVEPEKGHHILIKALAELKRRGVPTFRLDIVGPGSQIPLLTKLAFDEGIGDRVNFMGQVPPGSSLWAIMDQADLFILPSLTEGLPRALIEVMARGIPCLGSRTGGVPELLPDEWLVTPGNPTNLADLIQQCINSPRQLSQMSSTVIEIAKKYRYDEMQRQKLEFWMYFSQIGYKK